MATTDSSAAAAPAPALGQRTFPLSLETAAILVLHPGVVLIRGALPEPTQLALAEAAFERGDSADGWWVDEQAVLAHAKEGPWYKEAARATPGAVAHPESDAARALDEAPAGASPERPVRVLNVPRKNAGKVYDALDTYRDGDALVAFAEQLVAAAKQRDAALAAVEHVPPTHLLLWNYRPKKGLRIGWHRDNWQGDGTGDHPVISLSLGATCNFGWRPEPLSGAAAAAAAEPRSTLLESGDVILFGGPSRYMEHTVKSVHSVASAPAWFQAPHALGGGRLNFTFRTAPEAFGLPNIHRYPAADAEGSPPQPT